MKKLISSFIITIAVLISLSPIMASELPTVTFDGTTSLKYNVDAKSFSKVFEGMVPSESRTLNIQLKNTSDQDVNFYMSTEVLKAFEDTKKATNGTYKVSLYVTQNQEKTLIYGNQDGARVGANESGLYDLNGALSENYMLATLPTQKEATVSLNIEIDGTTVGNTYQGLPGLFQFDFIAQYPEVNEKEVINTIYKTTYIDNIIKKVQTGDTTSIMMIVGTLIVSAGVVVLIIKRGGHKNEK